jgi:hypothetical protein
MTSNSTHNRPPNTTRTPRNSPASRGPGSVTTGTTTRAPLAGVVTSNRCPHCGHSTATATRPSAGGSVITQRRPGPAVLLVSTTASRHLPIRAGRLVPQGQRARRRLGR